MANSTNTAMFCFDAYQNFYEFASYRYNEFGSFSGFLMAFFQNLIGNAVTLTKYET